MRQFVTHARGLAAAVLVLGFVAEVHAGVPGGLLLQRRGRVMIPAQPVNVDSSPTIDTLNKALRALGATDRDYDGHREKAIAHIGAAIQSLELPNARGQSNAAVNKAASGKTAEPTKTATTSQAASDESIRKAKAILFAVHHDLKDHTATKGHIKADAQVRIAIDELVAALKPAPATPPAATTPAATKPATSPVASTTARPSTTATTSTTATKPAKRRSSARRMDAKPVSGGRKSPDTTSRRPGHRAS